MQALSSDLLKSLIGSRIDLLIRINCVIFEIEEFAGRIPQKVALDSNVIKKDIDLIVLTIKILEVFSMNKSRQQGLEHGFSDDAVLYGAIECQRRI